MKPFNSTVAVKTGRARRARHPTFTSPKSQIEKEQVWLDLAGRGRSGSLTHKVVFQNEAQLRVMLAHAIDRKTGDAALPRRKNRRLPLIESALSTARHRFR